MSLPLLATKRHQNPPFPQASRHLGPQITSNFGLIAAWLANSRTGRSQCRQIVGRKRIAIRGPEDIGDRRAAVFGEAQNQSMPAGYASVAEAVAGSNHLLVQ